LFTGLIEEKGSIRRINATGEGASLVIGAKKVLSDLKTGDSIAVNGPCLTVTATDNDSFTAWAMPETLQRTNLSGLTAGQEVNLERALALGDRLGGHLVSGHIDAVVSLTGRRQEGGSAILTFNLPENLGRYIVSKGSVALDGVSLTVIAVDLSNFSVGLIPLTAAETTLGHKETGSPVNLEVDMIGKYVEKMLAPRLQEAGEQKDSITLSFLAEKGYL